MKKVIDNCYFKEVIECDLKKSKLELSYDLEGYQSTITRNLNEIEKVKRKSNKFPNFFMDEQIYQILIKKPQNDKFLKQIVITDEK